MGDPVSLSDSENDALEPGTNPILENPPVVRKQGRPRLLSPESDAKLDLLWPGLSGRSRQNRYLALQAIDALAEGGDPDRFSWIWNGTRGIGAHGRAPS